MYTTRLDRFTVSFPNTQEFHQLKREIFSQHTYYLEDDLESPVIIDAGAHIGLATLYFKSLWPDAKVTAIEPNPHTREYLQHNLEQNQIEDVSIIPVALSNQTGRDTLYIDTSADEWNSTASFFPATWTNTRPGEPITVDTEPLAKFLQQPVDILKLDVEGAEAKVLFAAGAALRQVRHLFVEFHGRPGNSLPNLLTFLEEQGFTCEVWKDGRTIEPNRVVGLAIIEGHQQ